MHKNPQRQNIDLHHLQQKRLHQGIAVIDQSFAKNHIDQIVNLHAWDYGFWLEYLDLQRQALNLAPIFEDLDEQADDFSYEINMKVLKTVPENERPQQYQQNFNQPYLPVVNQIINFWQTYPVTIYGSKVYLHAMAKTFFRNKVGYEEPAMGRQIKQALKDLTNRDWDTLQNDLLKYKGWWN